MACLTESGRVIDDSGRVPLELINGTWVPACSPLYVEEIFNARVLSDTELATIIERSRKGGAG